MRKTVKLLILLLCLFSGLVIGYKVMEKKYGEDIVYNEGKMDIESKKQAGDDNTITIVSVGNILFHDSQLKGAKIGKEYDFGPSFDYVKNIINKGDISFGTVETVFAGGQYGGYPTFNTPDEALNSIKASGINVVNYGHNHILDKNSAGVKRTMDVTQKANMPYVGIKNSKDAPEYIIKEVKGLRVGIMSYVYETKEQKGSKAINSILVPKDVEGLINTFNYDKLPELYSKLQKNIDTMKKQGVEFIILAIHWGEEYTTAPTNFQKDIGKKANELGIDLVLGGHPHVIQPCEVINGSNKNTLVTYSQGNFLSNQCYEELNNRLTEDGYILKVSIEKGKKPYIKDYEIIPTWVYREKNKDGLFTHRIVPVDDAIKDKNKFSLTDEALSRIKTSMKDTERILGEDVVNVFKLDKLK